MLYSPDGIKIKERLYSDFGFNTLSTILVINNKNGDRIFVLEKNLIEVNDELEVIRQVDSPFHSLLFHVHG